MNPPNVSVNAWILPSEDEPQGTGYQSPTSSFQSLVGNGVYRSTDMVNICFVDTVPTGPTTVPQGDGDGYTIQLGSAPHPGGVPNDQYMEWLIEDARRVNPGIKLLATMGYAADEISQIFGDEADDWERQAAAYAANVLAYLQHYDLDGLDVDWEYPFSSSTTPEQFRLAFTAIRAAFDAQDRTYWLTLSPADVGGLNAATVNAAFDVVNLQLYSGLTFPEDFVRAGVDRSLLAYGAKFEPNGGIPYQDAQQAYDGYVAGGYRVVTQWRLNSDDFEYEQAQQMILHQLVHGVTGPAFDDTAIVATAGNPPISQLVVRSGDVLDAIQATNAGTFAGNPVEYVLLRHGGDGGDAATVTIPAGDPLVEVSGSTGTWFGWDCVLQISLRTRSGKVFGPFGTMQFASPTTPFTFTAPAGQSIVAFSGTTVDVPVATGDTTDIVASLAVSCA